MQAEHTHRLSDMDWLNAQYGTVVQTLMESPSVLMYGSDPAQVLLLAQMALAELMCEASTSIPKPCGVCAGCRMRLANTHPDIQWLTSEATALTLGFDPELKSGTKPSQSIRMEDVRDLQNFFSISASRGRFRTLLVYPFEQLNINTSNALLKQLEEPSEGMRFILMGSQLHHAIPTIRSRCRKLNVLTGTDAQHQAYLQQHLATMATPPKDFHAEDALGLCPEGLLYAKHMFEHEREQLKLRQQCVMWLIQLANKHQPPSKGLEQIGMKNVYELAMRVCFDLSKLSLGLQPKFFAGLFQALNMRFESTQSQALKINSINILFHQIKTISRSAEHPLNPRLALENLSFIWHSAMSSVLHQRNSHVQTQR